MSILEVKNVSKSFGGVQANVDISVSVEQGSIVGLIGPNGSGKTTLFNSIVGTHPIDQGSIIFDNTEVSEMPVPAVAKLGLLRTFQQTKIYTKLNCVENMLISHKASDSGFIFAKIPADLTEKAENLLNFVGLYQKRKLRAGDLSFGQLILGWQYVALGVLIVVIVIYFPEGLMGWLREKYPERFGEVIDEKDRTASVELIQR